MEGALSAGTTESKMFVKLLREVAYMVEVKQRLKLERSSPIIPAQVTCSACSPRFKKSMSLEPKEMTNGELKRRVEKACKRNGAKIKVVEKISSTVKKELQRSNPFGQEHCKRNDCVTCNLGLTINCRKRGPVYEISCNDCEEALETPEKKYRGQTGRTMYHRMKEHYTKWENKSEESVLHKHSLECHGGERFGVSIKLLASCYGKPTTRLITEAIHIEEVPEENTLNEKSEWNYVKLPRVGMVE